MKKALALLFLILMIFFAVAKLAVANKSMPGNVPDPMFGIERFSPTKFVDLGTPAFGLIAQLIEHESKSYVKYQIMPSNPRLKDLCFTFYDTDDLNPYEDPFGVRPLQKMRVDALRIAEELYSYQTQVALALHGYVEDQAQSLAKGALIWAMRDYSLTDLNLFAEKLKRVASASSKIAQNLYDAVAELILLNPNAALQIEGPNIVMKKALEALCCFSDFNQKTFFSSPLSVQLSWTFAYKDAVQKLSVAKAVSDETYPKRFLADSPDLVSEKYIDLNKASIKVVNLGLHVNDAAPRRRTAEIRYKESTLYRKAWQNPMFWRHVRNPFAQHREALP